MWEPNPFLEKIGEEKVEQMWMFKDRGNRDVCLVPEITGIVQELWNDGWYRTKKKPYKIFYSASCFRYERPQKGRYRQFTQFGIEILGGKSPDDRDEAIALLKRCLDSVYVQYEFVPAVKRGIGYYTEEGFEVECANLGAQKQVAGGGRYKEGIGWAIGIDRLLLSKMEK